MVQGKINNNECGRCRGRIITTSESESVCSKCGWVVVDRVEDMATDYDVTRDGRGGRTGPPTNIAFDNASSSIIGRVNKDAGGNSLTSANKQTIDRLRQWDSRSQVSNSKSRNYLKAFSGNGKKIFIFGDMLELGEFSTKQHSDVGKKCKEVELSAVLTIGCETIATDNEFDSSIINKHFDNKNELISFFIIKN